MHSTEVKCGLRLKDKKQLLGYHATKLENPFASVGEVFELSEYGSDPWLTDSYERAQFVRVTNTESYNADYATPRNPYDFSELEVIEVVQTLKSNEDEIHVVKFSGFLEEGDRFFFSRENGNKNRERVISQNQLSEMNLFVIETDNPTLYFVINDARNQLGWYMLSGEKLFVNKNEFEVLTEEEMDEF